jgi:hypothetical protein
MFCRRRACVMTLGLPVSGEKSKKLINGSQHVCKIYRKPCMFVGKRVQKPFQWHLARQGETPEVHTISSRTLSDAGAHFHIGYKSITRVLQGILAFVTCSFALTPHNSTTFSSKRMQRHRCFSMFLAQWQAQQGSSH